MRSSRGFSVPWFLPPTPHDLVRPSEDFLLTCLPEISLASCPAAVDTQRAMAHRHVSVSKPLTPPEVTFNKETTAINDQDRPVLAFDLIGESTTSGCGSIV